MSGSVYTGGCYCNRIRWKISLTPSESARTSVCHCGNCKKWTGSAFGVTIKVPWQSFSYVPSSAAPVQHKSRNIVEGDSESDPETTVLLTREFCDLCGSGIREWGERAEGKYTFVCYGGLDLADKGKEDSELAPKGEFYCALREEWLDDVKGEGVFKMQKIRK